VNKKSKYYFLITRLILVFIITLIIGALLKIIAIYQYIEPNIFSAITIIFHVINAILIISICLGVVYLVYQSYCYLSSAFYRDYKINIFEALLHGILDMYLVYDKVKNLSDSKTIKVDFTNNIITFSKKNKHFSILFMDLFGRIDGKDSNDYWFSLSKPQKKYGKTSYAKTIRFPNPILVNQKYAEELKKETGNEYKDYVVLTGFYHMEFTNKKIIPPYEIISLVEQGKQD